MTPAEFVAMIAALEAHGLTAVKYGGLNDTFPRLVWREWAISQDYADNRAWTEHTTIMADLYTKVDDDPALAAFKGACRAAELPFECDVDYDEASHVIHYAFRLRLEEDVM